MAKSIGQELLNEYRESLKPEPVEKTDADTIKELRNKLKAAKERIAAVEDERDYLITIVDEYAKQSVQSAY